MVVRIEEYPKLLKAEEKINYNRVCDVECVKCHKVYFSQPYDTGSSLNVVRDNSEL